MAETQTKKPLAKVILLRLAQKLGKGGWALTSTVLVFTAVVIISAFLWQEYREELVSQSQFRLKAENLNLVTPQPKWIRSDVKQNAITRGRLHDALILDHDLGLRIQKSFLGSPWVKDVLLVNKSSARHSGINVSLAYREPVAMVIVDGPKYNMPTPEGLIPVDVEGFPLPGNEFDQNEANSSYPKISNIRSDPVGGDGQIWGDQLVVHAAQIAKLLRDRWKELGFRKLIAPNSDSGAHGLFLIEAHDGREIIWGSPPNQEVSDEAHFSVKLARLKEFSQLRKIPINSLGQPDLRIIQK